MFLSMKVLNAVNGEAVYIIHLLFQPFDICKQGNSSVPTL